MKSKSKRPKNIFSRLFLTSSITIIATVSILFIIISNYYSEVIIQREMDQNMRALERIDDYFSDAEQSVTNMVREVYANDELVRDLTYAMQYEYDQYLTYRLDRYIESSNFFPTDINTFFKRYFSQDDDVNALTLQSIESPHIEYLFIYNHSAWDRSIVSEVKEDIVGSDYDESSSNTRVKRELQDTYTITRNINHSITRNVIGTLSVHYTTEKLTELIDKEKESVGSTTFLLDQNDEILYASNAHVPVDIIQSVPKEVSDRVVKWEGNTYYVNSMVGYNNYEYIGIIPQKELNNLTFVKWTMWVAIAISIIVAIMTTYSFMRNYSSRIDSIDASIHEVEKGNLDVRIPKFKQKDELTTIAENFNIMLDELNDYIDEFYVVNMNQQQAELKALQSQINPHFLFNTLEVIRMSAVIEGSKTSSQMIYHLSRLFRYTLEGKESVPLYVELEHANQYLQLVQLQHPNKLSVVTDVPQHIRSITVQKLILQPIVENFMEHGFRKDRDNNQLEIKASEIDGKIKMTIKDNGSGITEERLKQVKEHLDDEDDTLQSIGLKNVHQRLKMKYGEEFGLTLESIENEGTIVTIVIPLGG